MSGRVVLHVDMDAFYVSVELRRRPELVGQPVVVGGTGPRGVVAAASYEARRFGVTSAMPSTVARRRCPHAVFLPGDHQLYSTVSRDVHEIFGRFTPDRRAARPRRGVPRRHGSDQAVRRRGRDRRDGSVTTCAPSSGWGARSASRRTSSSPSWRRWRRSRSPIPTVSIRARVWSRSSPDASSSSCTRSRSSACGASGRSPSSGSSGSASAPSAISPRSHESAVIASLGKANGAHLLNLSRGIDDRPVEVNRELKSVGHEETFAHDLHDPADLDRELVRLCDAVASRLRERHTGARTLTLKVRFAGFETITRSTTGAEPVDTGPSIVAALRPLLDRIDPTRRRPPARRLDQQLRRAGPAAQPARRRR